MKKRAFSVLLVVVMVFMAGCATTQADNTPADPDTDAAAELLSPGKENILTGTLEDLAFDFVGEDGLSVSVTVNYAHQKKICSFRCNMRRFAPSGHMFLFDKLIAYDLQPTNAITRFSIAFSNDVLSEEILEEGEMLVKLAFWDAELSKYVYCKKVASAKEYAMDTFYARLPAYDLGDEEAMEQWDAVYAPALNAEWWFFGLEETPTGQYQRYGHYE